MPQQFSAFQPFSVSAFEAVSVSAFNNTAWFCAFPKQPLIDRDQILPDPPGAESFSKLECPAPHNPPLLIGHDQCLAQSPGQIFNCWLHPPSGAGSSQLFPRSAGGRNDRD